MALMVLSVLAGVAVRRLQGPQGTPLPARDRARVAFAAVVGGAISAKLPFILRDPEALGSLWSWFMDGRTITWGMAGGYLSVELTKWAYGIKGRTGDAFAAPLAAAVAVGRLGCYRAGCCFGLPSSAAWAVDFGDGVLRHPTQLYEVAFHAVACVALLWVGRRGWLRYQRVKVYLIAYMGYRFVTEWLRPEPAEVWGLTFYQLSAAAFALALGAHWAASARAISRERAAPGSAAKVS